MYYQTLLDGKLSRREVKPEFEDSFELIVAGLGTAGSYAALAALEAGTRVLGIEKFSGVGGMGTYGYVDGYYYGSPGGLYETIDREAEKLTRNHLLGNVEAKKYLLEKKIESLAGKLLFEARVIGVFLDAERIKGVAVYSQGEVKNYRCQVLIDATGEAAVAEFAGASLVNGRKTDGQNHPYTSVMISLTQESEFRRTNHDSGYLKQSDPVDYAKGVLRAHSQQSLLEFNKKAQLPLFIAPHLGVRAGKRIIAEKVTTMREVLEGVKEAEPLFYAYADFDKHGKDNALESEVLQDHFVACNLSTVCYWVPITLENLIPQRLEGLLVAGRSIGVDYDLLSLVRMKRDMHKCGESAGVAASLAIKEGLPLRELPYLELKTILERSGCLDPAQRRGPEFNDSVRREQLNLLSDRAAIKAALSSDKPGIAFRSCQKLGNKISFELSRWLAEDDPELVANSALALGLIGESKALPLLRELVRKRDAFYFKDCRRTNQLRSAIAIYLLGKLADLEALPILEEILCSESEGERELYQKQEPPSCVFNPLPNFNEVYFQMIAHSTASLCKILARHPQIRERGISILKRAFANDRHFALTTSLPKTSYEWALVENVKNYALAFAKGLKNREGSKNGIEDAL